MIDALRLRKVCLSMLFVAFFLWFDLWLRSWVVFSSYSGMVCNSDGPFGVILPEWLLGIIGLVVIGVLVWIFLKDKTVIFWWPAIFILAGGLGNLLERVLFGCIMDYIHIALFPVFNIADILLTLGVVVIIMKSVKIKMESDNVK